VGKITLRVKTKGYQGRIRKSAKVYSNDPKNKVTVLRLSAFVKTSIKLSPRYVYLVTGETTETVTKVVNIKAELDKPLKLDPVQFNLAEKVNYTIEEIEKGRAFQVRFTTKPGGTREIYKGYLKLKTNYPEKPEISIHIRGRYRKKS
jgi:hypothetical protein